MRKIYFYFFLVLTMGCDEENPGSSFSERTMSVSADVITRSGMTTSVLHEIGLFVINDKSEKYSYRNVLMLKNSTGTFDRVDPNDKTPLKMVWGDQTTPVNVIAYAPYTKNADMTAFVGSVELNQSVAENVVKSDLVYQKKTVNPASDLDGNGNLAIAMKHQLSKLDIDLEFNAIPGRTIDHNPISKISVEGTKTHYTFNPSDATLSPMNINSITPLCSSISIPQGSVEGHATYECILVPQRLSAGAFKVEMTLYGMTYTYVLPKELLLTNNIRYTLSLKIDHNSQVIGYVTNMPWGDGSEDVLLPDLMSKVTFNRQMSTFPEHHVYDADKRELSLSFRGGVMELVFDGAYDKKLTVSSHDARLTVVDKPGTKYKNTHLEITALQVTNSPAYSVTINVKNALLSADRGVSVTIKVDRKVMPTVVMGNLRWMAYNGIGKSEELYMYEMGETSVRDVYRKRWDNFSAACMWGERILPPKPLIYPWEVVGTFNTGGTSIGASVTEWADNSTTIPCPDGWRVPSKEDFNKIWPGRDGVTANGTYTINDKRYTFAIQESGFPQIDVVGGTPISTNLLMISDGTNELLFPMIGWRARLDYAGENPLPAIDAGVGFYLWTKNKGSKNYNVYIFGVNKNKTLYNKAVDDNQAMAEAYNAVRCVQNL